MTLMVSVVTYGWSPVGHVALCPNTPLREREGGRPVPQPLWPPGELGGTTQTTPTFSRKVPHVTGESGSQTQTVPRGPA